MQHEVTNSEIAALHRNTKLLRLLSVVINRLCYSIGLFVLFILILHTLTLHLHSTIFSSVFIHRTSEIPL